MTTMQGICGLADRSGRRACGRPRSGAAHLLCGYHGRRLESTAKTVIDCSTRIDNGCLIYAGKFDTTGRPFINWHYKHHHPAWIVLRANRAPKPGEMCISTCDHYLCCEIDHLRWSSRSQVMQRRCDRARRGPRLKLWPDDVREIRRLFDQGRTMASVAEEYQMSMEAIKGIKYGRHWAWID